MPSGYRFTNRFWVYVIGHETGRQKVGFSNDPATRARALKVTGQPQFQVHFKHEVAPEDVRGIEKLAHHLLDAKALGREWFDVAPGEAIHAVASAVERYTAGERAPERDPETLVRKSRSIVLSASLVNEIYDWIKRQPGPVMSFSKAVRIITERAIEAEEASAKP